jgi:hypothetical protein
VVAWESNREVRRVNEMMMMRFALRNYSKRRLGYNKTTPGGSTRNRSRVSFTEGI